MSSSNLTIQGSIYEPVGLPGDTNALDGYIGWLWTDYITSTSQKGLALLYSPNPFPYERVDYFMVEAWERTCYDCKAVNSPWLIKVIQEGDPRRKMQVTPTFSHISWRGGTVEFKVTDIGAEPFGYTVQKSHGQNNYQDPDWVSLANLGGGTHQIRVEENSSSESRSHTFRVKVNDGGSSVVNDDTLITVEQYGAAHPLMTLSPTTIWAGSIGGSMTAFANNNSQSEISYEIVNPTESWVSARKGPVPGSVRIDFETNNTLANRTATITVRGRDLRGKNVAGSPATITFNQYGYYSLGVWVNPIGGAQNPGFAPTREDGTLEYPYTTVASGLSAVAAAVNGTVKIMPGNSREALKIGHEWMRGPLYLTAPQGVARLGVRPSGWVYNPTTEHWYKVTGNVSDWYKARNIAAAENGYLASINDVNEMLWLENYVLPNKWIFIGLTDEEDEGNWQWLNGDPVTYTRWSYGEPNNAGPGGTQEDIAAIRILSLWEDGTPTLSGQGSPSEKVGLVERDGNPYDFDGDGLSDALERYLGTKYDQKDSDGDGLSDFWEYTQVGTDPLKLDTDGDGANDRDELLAGTDPLDPNSVPAPDLQIVGPTQFTSITNDDSELDEGLYAAALPYSKTEFGERIVLPNEHIALRLRGNMPVEIGDIWTAFPESFHNAVELAWLPINDEGTDGWVIMKPLELFADILGTDSFEAAAGLTEFQSNVYAFVLGIPNAQAVPVERPASDGDPALEIFEVDGAAALEGSIGSAFRIEPEQVFEDPLVAWIPIQSDTDSVELMVFLDQPGRLGWYSADEVEGFLIEDSALVTSFNGKRYYRVLINHGAQVQLRETPED